MAPYVVTVQSSVLCPHGGIITFVPSHPEIQVGGHAVLRPTDEVRVEGCPFTTPDGHARPCKGVDWVTGHGSYAGMTVLTADSVGLASGDGGAAQGQVTIVSTQLDVEAGPEQRTMAWVLTTASTLVCGHGHPIELMAMNHEPAIEGHPVLRPTDTAVPRCLAVPPCGPVQWVLTDNWTYKDVPVLTVKSLGHTVGGPVQIIHWQTQVEAERH